MNTTRKQLERHALDAHRHGDTWSTFWTQHGDDVRQAEPYSRQRYHRLVRKLLALLTTGEPEQRPIATDVAWGSSPWVTDDAEVC